MRKILAIIFFATIAPVVSDNLGLTCKADDSVPIKNKWPDIQPVYNSYYDSSTNQLCIYGAAVSTMINVRIICRGNEVLYDYVSPEQLPAWYDCSSYDSGTYLVVISAGDTILSTFSFTKE